MSALAGENTFRYKMKKLSFKKINRKLSTLIKEEFDF